MLADRKRSDVCICNLSPGGMMLQSASPPPRGSYVDVVCGAHALVGRVVWSSEHRFGIRTRNRVDVEAMVKGAGRPPRADGTRARAGFAALSQAGGGPVSIDSSRHVSTAIQYGILAACGIAAAAFCAIFVYDLLAGLTDAMSPLG